MTSVNAKFSFKEIESLYGQLNGLTGGGLITSYGDVAWFSQALGIGSDIEQIAQGDATQKANGVKSIVKRLVNIIEKFGNQEANNARKDVNKTSKKAEELNKKSQELEMKLEGDLTEVADSVTEQTEIITEANELLNETQKSIKEKQAEIQKIVEEIEAKQEALKNEKDPKKQAELLAEIQGLAVQISTISLSIVEDDQKTIDNLTEAVTNAVEDIDNATEKMTVIEQDGTAQIVQLAQEGTETTTEVAKTAAEGTQNGVIAAEAQAAASAASSNVLTGTTVAPKLQQIASDQGTASTTRLSSIASNTNRIAQGIGGLNNNVNILSQFKNSIGSALDSFACQIGSWDSVLTPVITSIGSIATTTEGVEELTEAVESDLDNINYEVKDSGKVKKAKTDKKDNNELKAEANLLTPNVDVQKIVRNFGI